MAKKKNKDNPFTSRKAMKAMKKLNRELRKIIKKEMKEAYDKGRLLYGEPVEHDINSCNALKEYETAWENPMRLGPGPNMGRVADKYNTTIEEMKKHHHCHEKNKLTQTP